MIFDYRLGVDGTKENDMTVVRKRSEVPELNQAKLGLVKLRQSCWSNLQIVVSDQLTNLSFGTVSKLYKEIFEK